MKLSISKTEEGTLEYPLHAHPFWEIMFYVEGSGVLRTEAADYPFTIGTAIIVPPGVIHGSASPKGFINISIGGAFEHLLIGAEPLVIQDNDQGDGRHLANMIYRNRYGDPHYLYELAAAYIHYLLNQAKIMDGLNKALDAIHTAIKETAFNPELNVTEILQATGYSEDYIRLRFTKKYGVPPIRFLLRIRIDHACKLIEIYKNSISLSEISEKCGFTDYVYFSKTFKQFTGKSPRAYLHTYQNI